MSESLKTPAAAILLGASYSLLISLIRYGKLPPPRKDSSGDYVWTAQDLSAARKVLEQRRRREG